MMSQLFDLRPDGVVTYELRESVAWLGLNRPQKRNAIDNRLLAALQDSVTRAQAEAKAAAIFGHGPCFSAGLDLAEHRARGAEEAFHHSRAWHAVFTAIRRGLPVVGALHGATIGGGLELAAACHIRLADTTAFFALPEGTRGIYVGGGASVHVARLLGAARMSDMMLTGRVLDADMAERAGLVQVSDAKGRRARQGWRTRREGGGDVAANRARRAARAAPHPGHE